MFYRRENCKAQCTGCYLYSLSRRYLSKQVDVVVGISKFVLERHLKFGYFTGAVEKNVIHNAYRREPTLPRSSNGLSPIRFGYLGRLLPEKGIEVLLEAARQLPPLGAWSLDVAGWGQNSRYERYLRAKYSGPTVTFSGPVEVEAFFSSIDVLVVPSAWNEPFGRVVIEAYAHGIPVICSDRGGIPELVEEGRSGFLFGAGRGDKLAAKMKRLIDNPTMIEHMRSACLEKATDFLPENITKMYLDAYAELLGCKRPIL
jgi:glycosyltransferase involved in cell wall biosynthesis